MTPPTTGPILPALLRLALPNVLAMAAATALGIAETFYVGQLGLEALAGMALVFPFIMLTHMFSAGAMGGGVSSAVSRALGAGDRERAVALAWHALVIGVVAGVATTLVFALAGRSLYAALGGRGGALEQAALYSGVVFLGAVPIWLTNTAVSVLRGFGDMRTAAATILCASVVQIAGGAALGLGVGPVPRLGMAGIALGQVLAFTLALAFLLPHLVRGRVRLRWRGVALRREMFHDILKVGAVACLSPLQTVAVILIFTALVARHGVLPLAGYGIGVRLEFLLVPIAFGVGVAAVPMVGMAMGAGDVARARRVAWTAGGVSAVVLGAIGLVVALAPQAWAGQFTRDPAVLDHAALYLRWAGPAFSFFGLGLSLYFASQGSGTVLGPVLAGTLRFLLVVAGGSALVLAEAPLWTLFALVGAAMVTYGLATALAVHLTRWGPRPQAAMPRPATAP